MFNWLRRRYLDWRDPLRAEDIPFMMHIGGGSYQAVYPGGRRGMVVRPVPMKLVSMEQTGLGSFTIGYIKHRWLEGAWMAQRETVA